MKMHAASSRRAALARQRLYAARKVAGQKASPAPHAVLALGGCRSGKTAWAEKKCLELAETRADLLYIATAKAEDDASMQERIARHQAARNPRWQTLEAPLDLPETLDRTMREISSGKRLVILIDCVTLWLSNLMAAGLGEEAVLSRVAELCALLSRPSCPVFIVSNELGLGVAPPTALGNSFRDLAGLVNQELAKSCEEVYFIVSGLARRIKPAPYST